MLVLTRLLGLPDLVGLDEFGNTRQPLTLIDIRIICLVGKEEKILKVKTIDQGHTSVRP